MIAKPVLNASACNVAPVARSPSGLELAQAHVVGLAHASETLRQNPGDLFALVFLSLVLHDADAHPIAHGRARTLAHDLWPGKPYPNPCAPS